MFRVVRYAGTRRYLLTTYKQWMTTKSHNFSGTLVLVVGYGTFHGTIFRRFQDKKGQWK